MIVIVAGKNVKGPVTISVPAEPSEQQSSVASSRAPSGA